MGLPLMPNPLWMVESESRQSQAITSLTPGVHILAVEISSALCVPTYTAGLPACALRGTATATSP
jgi:hypothetical protein